MSNFERELPETEADTPTEMTREDYAAVREYAVELLANTETQFYVFVSRPTEDGDNLDAREIKAQSPAAAVGEESREGAFDAMIDAVRSNRVTRALKAMGGDSA